MQEGATRWVLRRSRDGAIEEWPTRGGAGSSGSSFLLVKEPGRLARDLGACPQPSLLLFSLGNFPPQQISRVCLPGGCPG